MAHVAGASEEGHSAEVGEDATEPEPASNTEQYLRLTMQPALRRQFQPIALRLIAEGGGSAPVSAIRQAISARHPDLRWDRRYPLGVLADNGIVEVVGDPARFTEEIDRPGTPQSLEHAPSRSAERIGVRRPVKPRRETLWRCTVLNVCTRYCQRHV